MSELSLRKRILAGEKVVGAFFKMHEPYLVTMMADNGFDFIIIDCEHGAFSHHEVEDLVRAVKYAGMSAIVRVATPDEEHIMHALDGGADGVQLPGLSTPIEVEEALKFARYYPLGERGYSTATPAARFGNWKGEQAYIPYANENNLTVVHVENQEMANHVEELCKIQNLDVLFVGPGDMSMSMGMPGGTNSPEVAAVVKKVFEEGKRCGKIVGSIGSSVAKLQELASWGGTYLIYASDVVHLKKAFTAAGKDIAAIKG